MVPQWSPDGPPMDPRWTPDAPQMTKMAGPGKKIFLKNSVVEGFWHRRRDEEMRDMKKIWNGGLTFLFFLNHIELCPNYENKLTKRRF